MWNTHLSVGAKIRQIAICLLMAVALEWSVWTRSSAAGTIAEILSQQPAFSDFLCLLTLQGLDVVLGGTESFTIFVPVNAAFDNFSSEMPHASSEGGDPLIGRQEVRGLIVPSRWAPQDLAGKKTFLKAMNGRSIDVDGTGGRLTVGDAEVLSVDVTPSNGVIYVIDTLTLDPY